jgi:DNA-binding NarL/FixJ family response regulator
MTVAGPRVARVLVVEDQRLMAELLVERLAADPAFEVCGTATRGAEAVRAAERTRPDLVVMDHRIGGGTGIDATRRIRAILPTTRVVMLTADTSDEVLTAAIRAGAVGYVHKHAVVAHLLDALRAALRGEAVLPQRALARIADPGATLGLQGGVLADALSRREREVLRLLAEGLDSKRLAQRLGVSYHTAREHAQRVIEKLGARSRLEAVARARERGIL